MGRRNRKIVEAPSGQEVLFICRWGGGGGHKEGRPVNSRLKRLVGCRVRMVRRNRRGRGYEKVDGKLIIPGIDALFKCYTLFTYYLVCLRWLLLLLLRHNCALHYQQVNSVWFPSNESNLSDINFLNCCKTLSGNTLLIALYK